MNARTTVVGPARLLRAAPVVVAVCTSQAASAAVLVFAAANERWMSPDAVLMLHQASLCSVSGTAREIAVESRELVRMNDCSCRTLAQHSGRPESFFVDMLRNADGDIYLNAVQALEYGLATKIGLPHLETRISVGLRICGGGGDWRVPDARERLFDVGPPNYGNDGKRKRQRPNNGSKSDSDSDSE
jgi:hypothetical protein